MLDELIRRGDRDCAELVQRQHCEPELVMPLQNEHDAVAATDAERLEVVGALIRGTLHLAEGKAALDHVARDVQHRKLVGIFVGDGVDDVVGEVERFLVLEIDLLQAALRILRRMHKLLDRKRLGQARGGDAEADLLFVHLLVAGHDDRTEDTVLAADGDHAVGRGGIVVDAVALFQKLDVAADLNLQFARKDVVEFLAAVRRHVDRTVLLCFGVFIADPVGLREVVAEAGREVADLDAVLARGEARMAAARHRIGRKICAAAFEDVRHADAEGKRAFMNKRKGKIQLTRLVARVFLRRGIRAPRHLLHRETGDLAHVADTACNLEDLIGGVHGVHCFSFLPVLSRCNHRHLLKTGCA